MFEEAATSMALALMLLHYACDPLQKQNGADRTCY
jgi:hypothetical protein